MPTFNRRLFLAGSAATLVAPGCTWLEGLKPSSSKSPTTPLEQRPAESFARYLNEQANAIDSISYEDVSVTVGTGGIIEPDLSAYIECSKPRSFRMKASHALQSGQLDVGSNDEKFWMYVRHVPKGQPQYVYASHADLASGRASLPIPFDPDWVYMALGMSGVDDPSKATREIDQNRREYILSYPARTPQGYTVKKMTCFAGDDQKGNSPQVKWHAVVDPKTNKSIATADITKVKRMEITNPKTGQFALVAIPTEVKLNFNGPDNQKLKLDLTLRRERVNPTYSAAQMTHLFQMQPEINGATPVNLANGSWIQGTTNARGQMPGRRY